MTPNTTESSFSFRIGIILGTLLLALTASLAQAAESSGPKFTKDGPFTRDTVVNLARKLSEQDYQEPAEIPSSLQALGNEQYNAIKFRDDKAVWVDQQLPYTMRMAQPGFFYKNAVEIATVQDGKATHIPYSADLFSVEPPSDQITLPTDDIGFAGLSLYTHLNSASDWVKTLYFQGATYFYGIGRNQKYGVSARGLAVKTGTPEGEEFPIFKAFWVERPTNDANSIVIHALMDSPSVTGAYRFTVRPGDDTVMDVEATLFPRSEISDIGLAPATSMFDFSLNGRRDIDDYRPEVHNSDGLLMVNGRNERIFRPLANPAKLQMSAFVDTSPIGFGLTQRDRDFSHYQDLDAHFEQRPSLWVEPLGDWGKGSIVLTEIPTDSEIHDNITAFWKPAKPLTAHKAFSYAYRLIWGKGPAARADTVVVESTRRGRADVKEPTARRLFVIDYRVPGDGALPADLPTADINASAGAISDIKVEPNPAVHGYRLSFVLDPDDIDLSELRAKLNFIDQRPVETWVYRWTAG